VPDVIILGGGLSGLSLALALARRTELSVLVLESRRAYQDDRTWSCFQVGEEVEEAWVGQRWPAVEVARPGRSVRFDCSRSPYCAVPAGRFYAAVVAEFGACERVELRLGVQVEAVVELEAGVRVWADGRAEDARLAFDSRPPGFAPGGLVQRFEGFYLETEADAFEPGVARLMDFRGEPDGAVHFTYVLPFSARSALVEDTWFAPSSFVAPEPLGAVRRYLQERDGVSELRVLRRERGRIPMDASLQPPQGRRRVLPIGTRGGAVRPSSGYAFVAIQRQSRALADQLAGDPSALQGGVEAGWRRPAWTRFMDGLFLDALEHRPERAPDCFVRLFEHTEPAALLRFLDGSGSWRDHLAVAASLPSAPFVAQLLASAWARLGTPRRVAGKEASVGGVR
jgi:lycopene beta-cyclase